MYSDSWRAIPEDRPFRMAVLDLPVDKDYLALARLTVAHVAGLLGLPLRRLSDLKLAVDEACSLLLTAPPRTAAAAGSLLELRFERCARDLRITVRGPAPEGRPDPDGFGWLMLRALVGDARMETVNGTATVTLLEPLGAS